MGSDDLIDIPQLPPGFTLDEDIPPPPGFTLDPEEPEAPRGPTSMAGEWKKGFIGALADAGPESVANALEGFAILNTSPPDKRAAWRKQLESMLKPGEVLGPDEPDVMPQLLRDLAGSVREYGARGAEQRQLAVPNFTDVFATTDLGELFDRASSYIAGASGQAVGSATPAIATGTIGAAATKSPWGFIAGAAMPSYIQNFGDTFGAMRQDPEIQQAIAAGKITEPQLASISAMVAVPIAALDAYGLEKALGIDGRAFRGNLIKRAMKAALVGGLTEGSTEAAQQLIQEAALDTAGADTKLADQAVSVLNAGVAGMVGGTTFGAAMPGRRSDKTEAAPAAELGVVVPPSEMPGQPTPGGYGTPAPPPAAVAPAVSGTTATPPPAAAPVVVEPGAVDPDLVVAASTETVSPAGGLAVPRPPAAAAGVAPPAPAVAAPVDEDIVEEAPPEPSVDTEEDQARVALERQRTRRALAALAEQADKIVPSQPGADLTAAIQAQAPQAVPQVASPVVPVAATPAVPGREPLGTAEAALRRAQPAVLPVAEPTPTPVSTAAVGAAEPIAAPPVPPSVAAFRPSAEIPPLPPGFTLDPEPVSVAVAPRPVQRTPIIQGPTELVRATSAPVTAPAPIVAPKAAAVSPLGRQLLDRVRQELYGDVISEQPGSDQAMREAVTKQMQETPPQRGVSPSLWLDENAPRVASRVREVLQQREIEQRTAEAQTEVKQLETAKAQAAVYEEQTVRREGKNKGKTAKDIAREDKQATVRRARKEMAKPEAERDQDLVEYAQTYEQLAGIKGRGERTRIQRELLGTKLEAARKRYVEKLEAAEKAEASPPPPVVAQVDEKQVKPGSTSTPEASAQRERNERDEKLEPKLRAAIDSVPLPAIGERATMKSLSQLKPYLKDVVKAVQAAAKEAGVDLQQKVGRRTQTPVESLAIFARELLSGKKHFGMGPAEFITAKLLLDAGQMDEFYNLVSQEELRGGAAVDFGDPGLFSSDEAGTDRQEQYDVGGPKLSFMQGPSMSKYVEGKPNTEGFDVVYRTTGKELLKNIREEMLTNPSRQRGGLYDVMYRLQDRMLRQLVGDVPIVYATRPSMAVATRKPGVLGVYVGFSPEERRAGERPYIALDADLMSHGATEEVAHIVLHELTHAATMYALETNLRRTDNIVSAIRGHLLLQIRLRGGDPSRLPHELSYGLSSNEEFLAEAFSSPVFQHALSQMDMPENLDRSLRALTKGVRKPTWWDVVIGMVANAINVLRPIGRTRNFLEGIVSVHPLAHVSEREQQLRISMAAYQAGQPKSAQPKSPFHMAPMLADMDTAMQTVTDGHTWAADMLTRSGRRFRMITATTGELMRRSARLFGGEDNVFTRYASAVLERAHELRENSRAGDAITAELADYHRRQPVAANEMADVLYEATASKVDPTSIGNNKHISKAGWTDEHLRVTLAALKQRWSALPAEAQALGEKLVRHYATVEDLRVRKLVRNVLNQALADGRKTLPAGVSIDDAIDWVVNGGVDRPAPADPKNPEKGDRTAADQALHDALGKTAGTLAGTKEMRKIAGVYVPLMRRGRLFFTARHKIDVPSGAVLDPNAEYENVLMFLDKKKLQAFVRAGDPDGKRQILSVSSRNIDPATGERVNAKDARAVQVFYVTLQNRHMEMGDNELALDAKRKELEADGYTVSQTANTSADLNRNSEVLPSQIRALIRNIEGSSKTENVKNANIGALVDAYIKQIAGNRAAHRRLKRNNVKGFSRDLIQNTMTANRALAGSITNLDRAPRLADLEKALDDYIERGRKRDYPSDRMGSTLERQAMVASVKARAAVGVMGNEYYGADTVRVIKEVSFIRHLATVAYTMANLLQAVSTTLPRMAAKLGAGQAVRQISRAMYDLGARDVLQRGTVESAKDVWGATFGLNKPLRDPYDYYHSIRARVASQPDGPLLQQMLDRLEQLGFGTGGGIEAPELAEVGRNKAGILLNRVARVSRALPEAAEAINRYTVGIAMVRAAKERGRTDAQAIADAVSMVEETQFGYSAENNPTLFSKGWWSIPLQFKKYAIGYAQLFWGNVYRSLALSTDRETRLEAARTVAYMTLASVALSGTVGWAPMEIGRALALMLAPMTGDDWEEWENWMQSLYNDMLGETAGEALSRGLFRLAGIDMSSRLANDSMVLFGEPRQIDEANTKSWILDMLMGAPGGMIADELKAAYQGDIMKMLPLPKFFYDVQKTAGSIVDGDYPGAAAQLAGLRLASEARPWEAGGKKFEKKQDVKMMAERTSVMGEYANSPPALRSRVWQTTIRDWNSKHPGKRERIEMQDLRRSIARRKQLEKENK